MSGVTHSWPCPRPGGRTFARVTSIRPLSVAFALLSASAVMLGLTAGNASAVGEVPHDYALSPRFSSHFYTLGETRLETGVGAPYVTVKDSDTVLSMDWDGELASTNVNTKAVTLLGSLGLPGRSRLLDFQYFSEWPATKSAIPVFVSYAYLNEANDCRYLVLRQATLDPTGAGKNRWGRTLFTSPCYPNVAAEEGSYFLNQSGGRMALVPPKERKNPENPEFMLTIGDFKALVTPPKMSAEARRTLGTIVRITAPGTYEIFSRGLRNSQGIVYGTLDGKPAVLATSQGPRGGDEVVHATQGADFGWPTRNYGTAYRPDDTVSKPAREGAGGSKDLPIFAFVPSTGLSAAMQVKGPAFSRWWSTKAKNGTPDLIVAGMGARWLYRLRIEDGAVRYFEGLMLGARARSLAQLPNGYIITGLDDGTEFLMLQPVEAWSPQAGTFVKLG